MQMQEMMAAQTRILEALALRQCVAEFLRLAADG